MIHRREADALAISGSLPAQVVSYLVNPVQTAFVFVDGAWAAYLPRSVVEMDHHLPVGEIPCGFEDVRIPAA